MKKTVLFLTVIMLMAINFLRAENKNDTVYVSANGKIEVFISQKTETKTLILGWENPGNYSFSDKEMKELMSKGSTQKIDSTRTSPVDFFPPKLAQIFETTVFFINDRNQVDVKAIMRTYSTKSWEKQNGRILVFWIISILLLIVLWQLHPKEKENVKSKSFVLSLMAYLLMVASLISIFYMLLAARTLTEYFPLWSGAFITAIGTVGFMYAGEMIGGGKEEPT